LPDAVSGLGKVTWLGHSTALIEMDGVRVLTDPVLRGRVAHLRRVPATGSVPKNVDAVLVSHAHRDHLDVPSLARFGRDLRIVVPEGAGRALRRRGFRQVGEVAAGQEVRVARVVVRATRANHGAHAVGYVVGGSRLVYFAGDTDVFAEMSDLAPGLDLALLPVWGWGRRVGRGHMDPRRAARALQLLRPRVAVPIHWGTLAPLWWRTASRSSAEPALAFERLAGELAPSVDVRVLPPGSSTAF
jgi:L-ascorbate metabolism protein UlaG (beta-lactamase superfamily)